MNEKQPNVMFKLNILEQQIKNVNAQIDSVERTMADLDSLKIDLDELKGSKEKEIMALIGRGIFIKAKIISEDLMVDVGGGRFVKKDVSETKGIITEQIEKLEKVKDELNESLMGINEELNKTVMDEQ